MRAPSLRSHPAAAAGSGPAVAQSGAFTSDVRLGRAGPAHRQPGATQRRHGRRPAL